MADNKFTRKEIAARGDKEHVLVIIENRVYDLSAFIDEHPGGHEVLVAVSGQDASEEFQEVGHSLDAKELMVKYRVGELVDEDKVELKKRTYDWNESANADQQTGFMSSWKFPLVLGLLATVLYSYLFG